MANRHNVTWQTKHGLQKPDYFGSITQSSTVHVASAGSEEIYVAMNQVLPMVHPNDIEIGGWDINNATLDVAMQRAEVLPFSLQQQVQPFMQQLKPLPGLYIPHFIASNQDDRANHVLPSTWTMQQQMEQIRSDIRDMKKKCDKVWIIVIYSFTLGGHSMDGQYGTLLSNHFWCARYGCQFAQGTKYFCTYLFVGHWAK